MFRLLELLKYLATLRPYVPNTAMASYTFNLPAKSWGFGSIYAHISSTGKKQQGLGLPRRLSAIRHGLLLEAVLSSISIVCMFRFTSIRK